MKSIIWLYILFVLFGSCMSKPVDNPCSENYIDVRLDSNNSHLYFRTGSYWTYIDTINKAFDSMFVIDDEYKEYIYNSCRDLFHLTKYKVVIYSSFYKDTITYVYSENWPNRPPHEKVTIYETDNSSYNFYYFKQIMFSPPFFQFENLNIQGKVYNGHIASSENFIGSNNAKVLTVYLSKNIGIIRKVVIDKTTKENLNLWELKNYSIN